MGTSQNKARHAAARNSPYSAITSQMSDLCSSCGEGGQRGWSGLGQGLRERWTAPGRGSGSAARWAHLAQRCGVAFRWLLLCLMCACYVLLSAAEQKSVWIAGVVLLVWRLFGARGMVAGGVLRQVLVSRVNMWHTDQCSCTTQPTPTSNRLNNNLSQQGASSHPHDALHPRCHAIARQPGPNKTKRTIHGQLALSPATPPTNKTNSSALEGAVQSVPNKVARCAAPVGWKTAQALPPTNKATPRSCMLKEECNSRRCVVHMYVYVCMVNPHVQPCMRYAWLARTYGQRAFMPQHERRQKQHGSHHPTHRLTRKVTVAAKGLCAEGTVKLNTTVACRRKYRRRQTKLAKSTTMTTTTTRSTPTLLAPRSGSQREGCASIRPISASAGGCLEHLFELGSTAALHLRLVRDNKHWPLWRLLQLQHIHCTPRQVALPGHTHSHAAVLRCQQLAGLLAAAHVSPLHGLAAAAVQWEGLNSRQPRQPAHLQRAAMRQAGGWENTIGSTHAVGGHNRGDV